MKSRHFAVPLCEPQGLCQWAACQQNPYNAHRSGDALWRLLALCEVRLARPCSYSNDTPSPYQAGFECGFCKCQSGGIDTPLFCHNQAHTTQTPLKSPLSPLRCCVSSRYPRYAAKTRRRFCERRDSYKVPCEARRCADTQ